MSKRLNLQAQITLLVLSVVFLAILIIVIFMGRWTNQSVENHVRSNIANIAAIIAHTPNIRAALAEHDPHMEIQAYMETLRPYLTEVEYIVVADMNGIRYSHPNPELLGKGFLGGDEVRVLKKGESYISEAVGYNRISLRAFAPVYDLDNDRQIGFVAVGILRQDIIQTKSQAVLRLMLVALLALGVGALGAFLLGRSIKNTLLGLEPEEISRLYNEKAGILDAIHEGLIAIDDKNRITLINESALKILKIAAGEGEIIGRDVEEIIPFSRLLF